MFPILYFKIKSKTEPSSEKLCHDLTFTILTISHNHSNNKNSLRIYRMKKLIFLSIILRTLFLEGKKSETACFGVQAIKDCELLRTSNSILLFERNGNMINSTYLKFEKSIVGLVCRLFGKVSFNGNNLAYKYMNTNLESLIEESSVGEIIDHQRKIKLGGNKQVLNLVEEIKIFEPYEMVDAERSNIGLCLSQWRLGTKMSYENKITYYKSGTNKHNHVFIIKNDYIINFYIYYQFKISNHLKKCQLSYFNSKYKPKN